MSKGPKTEALWQTTSGNLLKQERLRPWKPGTSDSDKAMAEVFNRKDWTIYEGSSSALVDDRRNENELTSCTADETDKSQTPKFVEFTPPRPYHDEAVYLHHSRVRNSSRPRPRPRDDRQTRSRSPVPPSRRYNNKQYGYKNRKHKVPKPDLDEERDSNGNIVPRPVVPSQCCRPDNPRLRVVPPVFISTGTGYSGRGGGNGGGRSSFNPCDRLANVEITEELKYYTPGDGPSKCEPAYDCYSICNECGEAELVGECPPECCPKPDCCPKPEGCDPCGKPVTYTRRQKFNFQDVNTSDPDGPPFKWPYDTGKQGNPCARPYNPYDEIPVGKQIQKKKQKHKENTARSSSSSSSTSSAENHKNFKVCGKPKFVLPCESGKYLFDSCRNTFEHQSDEPTKIVLNDQTPCGPSGSGCAAQGGGCSAQVKPTCQCAEEEEQFEEQVVEERIVPDQCDVAALMQQMLMGCGMGGGGCMPGMGLGGCMPGMGMGGCMPGMGMGGCMPGMGMGGCMPGMGMGGCMPGMGMGGCMPGMAGYNPCGLGGMGGGGGLGLNGCTLPIMMMPGGTQPSPVCGPCGYPGQQQPSCQGSSCASSSKKHKKHRRKRSPAEETIIDFQTESSQTNTNSNSSSVGPSVSMAPKPRGSSPPVQVIQTPWSTPQQSAAASLEEEEGDDRVSVNTQKVNVDVKLKK